MIKQLFSLMLAACAAVILVTSCQDPAPEKDPNQEEEIKQIPFSLTVSTEATKVSYANGRYEFKSGDKLRVVGVNRTDIQGDLVQNGNMWSGVLTYTGNKPDEGTLLKVTLIHADNDDASSYAFALVGTVPNGSSLLREAVEKYSLFTSAEDVQLSYTTVPSVVLNQQAAFLDVTVTFDFDGSRTVEAGQAMVDLIIGQQKVTVPTNFIALDNNEDFKVNFMAVVPGGQPVSAFTLTVGDREITFSENTPNLVMNKKYTVTRTIDYRPQIGDPLWSDGTYGRLRHADSNASIVGVIVYVNRDKSALGNAITEKTGDKFGHGLVMALHNIEVELTDDEKNIYFPWSNSTNTLCTGANNLVTSPAQTLDANKLSGYSNTQAIIEALGENAVSAASLAASYNVPVSLEYTTGWFLPSIGQWMYTISVDGFGQANPANQWTNGNGKNWLQYGTTDGDLVYVKENGGSGVNILVQSLNDRLATFASDFSEYRVTYDPFGDPSPTNNVSDNYWTSSERSTDKAVRMNLGSVEPRDGVYYATIKAKSETKTTITVYKDKNNVEYKMKVRPFLAF